MMRNVELKTPVDEEDWNSLLDTAARLSGGKGELLKQQDIFFNSPNGRLKMRHLTQNGLESCELIWYERANTKGPKLSTFQKVTLPSEVAKQTKDLLILSNGVRGEVKKERRLFIVGQTRVHCDHVEGLGKFVELEVCLEESQTVDDGENVAVQLKEKLGIACIDHDCAYIDLLLAKK